MASKGTKLTKPTGPPTRHPHQRQALAVTAGVGKTGMQTLIVVYIHGIGNKPAPPTLKRQWDHALFGLDMGARSRLAYWADIIYPQPLPANQTDEVTPQPEAYHPSAAVAAGRPAASVAMYGPDAERYASRVAETLLGPGTGGRPGVKGVGKKILPGIIRKPVVAWLTKTFIQDTAAYFFDQARRDEMRQRLRQILLAQPGPFVIVAHSQGSIIAHDVLREFDDAGAPFEVPLLVTFGSPLGLAEVQDHLRTPLRIPRVVKAWENFADLLDPLAADKTLADEFKGAAPVDDHLVINRDTLRISAFNPHAATGYLATTEMRDAVRRRLPTDFVAPITPFVIARDVATDMADPTQRLPVLIELKHEESTVTLDEIRTTVVEALEKMESALKKRTASDRTADLKIDPLQRFVGADLTADEIDRLAAQHTKLQIVSVWKNSEKRTLLDKSTSVLQVRTAKLGYGASGQKIHWAVLDTGILAAHPHFDKHKNVVAQWDCTQVSPRVKGKPATPSPGAALDRDGHGTHVAGIIAGTGAMPDGAVLDGMAPEAKLHVYKVLDDSGNGKDSWIIKALDHIARTNDGAPELVIHGVNLSLGGPFDESVFGCGFSPICRELRRLWRQGVVVCIAAGNEGRLVIDTSEGEQKLNLDLSIGDPANLEDAIAVGSVHRDSPHLYGISYFSSRGPTADGRAKPDVVAPGEGIMSCNVDFPRDRANPYIAMSGTSMACPHVSGLIAAFLSVRREFIGNPDRVKEILMTGCTDIKRDRYHQGAGIPNLVRMLMTT